MLPAVGLKTLLRDQESAIVIRGTALRSEGDECTPQW
jgi:hypothetical protein